MCWQTFSKRWRAWWSLGARGERWAEAYYCQQGAQVLARNWRWGRDEIDLVMLEENILVFVEVKTRTVAQGGEAYGAVNRRKKTALRRAVRGWLWEIGGRTHFRFDIVEVLVCHHRLVRILQHRGEPLLRRHSS